MYDQISRVIISCFMLMAPMNAVFAEDVFITRTGKFYYAASSPFIKTRATLRMPRAEAESRGYKPSKSYLKTKEKESRAPAASLQQQY